MIDYPVKKDDNEITELSQKDVQAIGPSFNPYSFINFRYSYKSISLIDGKTHIESKEHRIKNGKFETEEFEETTSGDVFTNMISDIQKFYVDQMSVFLRSFSAFFLPFSGYGK